MAEAVEQSASSSTSETFAATHTSASPGNICMQQKEIKREKTPVLEASPSTLPAKPVEIEDQPGLELPRHASICHKMPVNVSPTDSDLSTLPTIPGQN